MAMTVKGASFDDFVGGDALARVRGESGLHSRLPSSTYTDSGFLTSRRGLPCARARARVGGGRP